LHRKEQCSEKTDTDKQVLLEFAPAFRVIEIDCRRRSGITLTGSAEYFN